MSISFNICIRLNAKLAKISHTRRVVAIKMIKQFCCGEMMRDKTLFYGYNRKYVVEKRGMMIIGQETVGVGLQPVGDC